MAPLRPLSTGGPTMEFHKGFRGSFRTTSQANFLTIILVMPEKCNSGAPMESRVAGFRGTVSQAVGVQCSAAAVAYRGEPAGD